MQLKFHFLTMVPTSVYAENLGAFAYFSHLAMALVLLWTSSYAFSYDSREFYKSINPIELNKTNHLALNGDFDSIYFMYRYYLVGKSDEKKSMSYVQIGADHKISFFDIQLAEFYYKKYSKCISNGSPQCSDYNNNARKYANMALKYSTDFPDQNVYSSDIKNQADCVLQHRVNHYLF